MINIGIGSIITGGLGGPAANYLIFGPFHLYINPLEPPTPTPTPTIGGGGGGSVGPSVVPSVPWSNWAQEKPDETKDFKKYEVTIVVKFSENKKIQRTFTVSEQYKNIIIKRINQINTLKYSFKVKWNNIKEGFKIKWKS